MSSNARWDKELNEKLNLNHEILKRNREQTLRGVIEGINSKRGKGVSWTQKDVKEQLEKWSNKHDDGNGHAVYYPFHGIVVCFLKKKLATLSKKEYNAVGWKVTQISRISTDFLTYAVGGILITPMK